MSRIEDVKNWIVPDVYGPGQGPKPVLSLEEAMATHREAVVARETAEIEAAAAEKVFDEKSYALKTAAEVERHAAALLVEASARTAGSARGFVVQDAPRRRAQIVGAGGEVLGYTTDAS